MLPQKWYSASGSTPILKKHGTVPILREHSHKSGVVLPGVLPNKLKLYTGSDLDIICNLDILLPLDTLGTLSVLLFFFWFWGVLPIGLYYNMYNKYSHWQKISLLGVLPTKNKITEIIISCQDHSHCTILVCLGVLLEVLFHFGRSAPAKVVQDHVWLIQEYSQKHYTTFVGALPQKWYSTFGSTPKHTKLYNGSDLNMIFWSLYITTTGHSGSPLSRFIFGFWEYSQ